MSNPQCLFVRHDAHNHCQTEALHKSIIVARVSWQTIQTELQTQFPAHNMSEVLVPYISCLLVLDSDGDRIIAKYYNGKPKAEQIKFEAMMHKKTKSLNFRSDAEIILLDQEIIVVKGSADCKLIICGSVDENELILVSVLDAVFDTILTLLRGQFDKRVMLDNLELILLTIDEVIDHGQIMELEATSVASRVLMKGSADVGGAMGNQGTAAAGGDMTISQALGLARNQFIKSLTSGN